MFLTRFAKLWWAAPLLVPLLGVDLWWFGLQHPEESAVGHALKQLFPEPAGDIDVSYPRVMIWADGDARVVAGSGYLTSKPLRQDVALGSVVVESWDESSGFLAPYTRERSIVIYNWNNTVFPGISITSAVISAFADAGHPFPEPLRNSLRSEGVSTVTDFVWWGAAHDLVVAPAWIVAFGAIVFRVAAVINGVRDLFTPVGVCTKCRYDLNGLPPGSTCPECGEAFANQPPAEQRRNAA